MTLPQVQALGRHFQKLPPLRVSLMAIASALGVKFPEAVPDSTAPPKSIDFVDLPEFE